MDVIIDNFAKYVTKISLRALKPQNWLFVTRKRGVRPYRVNT